MKRLLIFALLLVFAVPALATDFVWDNTAEQAWATNHWGRGGVAPVYPGDAGSDPADTITIIGATPPTDGPAASLTVASFICQGNDFGSTVNLIIDTGGTLIVGTPLGTDTPGWYGETGSVGTFEFNGRASNFGTVGDHSTWNDDAHNYTGTVGDYSTWNDSACNGDVFNTGTVGDYSAWNDSSRNNGTVGDYSTWNDYAASYCGSIIGEHSTWNDNAQNDGATLGNYATFNALAYNTADGTVGDFTTINSTGTQLGTWTGTTYYLSAAATFDDTCLFTGTPPVTFVFTGTTADLIGTITSDGGTTPITYNINVNAAGLTVTAQRDLAPYTFTITAGTFAGNSQTYTVGAGGFTFTNGTISGTLDVDLSAAAGAYTQTGGEVTGTLNVTCGTGGFTWTALTQTGTINITTAGITALADWGDAAATTIDTLTINAATTMSGPVYAKQVIGNALLTIGPAAQDLSLFPAAADFLSGTFAAANAGASISVWSADDSNSGTITLTGAGYLVFFGDDTTWTQTGAMSVSTLRLDGKNAKYGALIMNAPLTVTGTLNFGYQADNDRDGKLTLGSGFVHRIGTMLRHANNTSTGHTFTIGGRLILGGDVTLAGITTAFGDAKIDATAALTFDGATATGTTSGNCIITGRGGLVTFANMETNFTGRPILARRFTTDAGSVVAVQPLAPHWLTGMR